MSCHASTAGWNSGHNAGGAGPNSGWSAGQRRCGPPRGLEIAGIVLGFIFFWPAALAYLIWKCTGYPVPNEAKAFFEKNFSRLGGTGGWPWNGAGNGARGAEGQVLVDRQLRLRGIPPARARAARGRAPPPRRGGDRVRRVRRGAEAGKGPRRVRRLHGKAPPRAGHGLSLTPHRVAKRSALAGAPFVFGFPFACFPAACLGAHPRLSALAISSGVNTD